MTIFEQARQICITMLSVATENINTDFIRQKIIQVNQLFNLSETEQHTLQEQLEALYAVFSDKYRILDDKKPEPWVKSIKAEIQWNFWNRYRMLLEQKNYAPDTINQLDNLTDDLLDRLIRPGNNIYPFDKRGLIVGHVQSGKTGNYIGLICKAADIGYKLIIVLAGIHNSLRSQTQLRVDEGFLGFDTQMARNFTQTTSRIGVGKINPNLAAHSLTTNAINGDFNRRASESSGINIRGNDPIILVIKKNASVMKNLLSWLANRGEMMEDGKKQIKNLPLLVIDDEADNASINISKNHVSGINACIRSMLKLFEQSAYIGYTATPYANIFIKQYTDDDVKGLDYNINNIPLSLGNDIFPKNFIVNIPAPSNYIGPEKLFGIESLENIEKDIYPLRLFRKIDDHESFIPEKHKKDLKPSNIPSSLHKAIKCFFLSCAARRVRGQENVHNSMLIHVTRFIDVQDEVATLVENEVKNYVRRIEFSDTGFIRDLEQLWKDEFIKTTKDIIDNPSVNDLAIQPIAWEQVEANLYPAVAKIEVRAIHGDTKVDRLKHKNIRPLDYYDNPKGLSVIAIGGNKLSRGLTLEGLTISYFLRASKMYDTLMQMGRWFGYRPGYLDLCRLFTSNELIEWYEHITVATEEMRAEFDRMGDLDKTPTEYGLKVRTHSGALVITASNKFRYKKIMELSFSGELEETYSFRKNDPIHLENYTHTLAFITSLGLPDRAPNNQSRFRNHFVWRGKGNAGKVMNYLERYQTKQPSFNVRLMSDYIQAQQKSGKLSDWTIVLINNTDDKKGIKINEDVTVGLTKRTDAETQLNYYTINKSHIIDPRHEYIDLTDEQIENALNDSRIDAEENGKDPLQVDKPSPIRIKKNRPEKQALLLIYLLNPKPEEKKAAFSEMPLVGLATSFPWIENDEKIEYAVNQRFLEELDYIEELDEEELDEPLVAIIEENKQEEKEALWGEIKKIDAYWKPDTLQGVTSSKLSIISIKEKGTPLVQEDDIHRYYINPYIETGIIDKNVALIDKGFIVTTAITRVTQKFALSEQPLVINSSCLAFRSPEIPSEYLLALFNSALFAFYNSEAKDRETKSVIEGFPVVITAHKNIGIISLVKSILLLEKDKASRDSRILSSYFINVLDVAVFEIYFPEVFKNNHLSVLSELNNLEPFDNDTKDIKGYYQILNSPQNVVKKAVYAINTIPRFKFIYQTLTNEN
ncbi:Z1 domain-containing protein [Chryseobacterium kwangjuense]|uniref:Z1 domain-containing protein n=1 Tax=Chryseobacterium kwangjuense TaxID=267125 RepID=A0ABW9JXE0_9FLAO